MTWFIKPAKSTALFEWYIGQIHSSKMVLTTWHLKAVHTRRHYYMIKKPHHYVLVHSPFLCFQSCHGCYHSIALWFRSEGLTLCNLVSDNTVWRLGAVYIKGLYQMSVSSLKIHAQARMIHLHRYMRLKKFLCQGYDKLLQWTIVHFLNWKRS